MNEIITSIIGVHCNRRLHKPAPFMHHLIISKFNFSYLVLFNAGPASQTVAQH